MKLIIGLGNPGDNYKNNRHNVGHMVIDALASKIPNSKTQIPNKSKILIFKSQKFMNESGEFVKRLVEQYHMDSPNLWVIHDDLDIPLGSYKIQRGKGPKLHNGILSIERELGSDNFWRVRIGVDNRIGDKTPGEEYVLQDFTEEEREELKEVINKVAQDILSL